MITGSELLQGSEERKAQVTVSVHNEEIINK